MAIRYVSKPRRRSGTLSASIAAFLATGSGSAASPIFDGTLLSLLPQFTTEGTGEFTGSGGGGTFTPTHYVTSSASGSGDGSLANPYTLSQACSLAQPGWRVRVAAGTYIGPNNPNDRFAASFRITTLGTQANPIIFFAENYAAISSSGLSILQHPGTMGSGCPVLGASGGHHWYGFFINEDDAPTTPDTGPVVCSGQFNKFAYMRVTRGDNIWPVNDNNHAAFRFEGNATRNNTVSDCLIENYHGGQITGGVLSGAAGSEQGIQVYGPTDTLSANYVGALTIENNVFYNCQYAVTVKSINGRLIEGGIIMRRNLLLASNYNVDGDVQSGGINFIGVGQALGRNQVYQNIQVGGANLAQLSFHAYACVDVDIINNTCINLFNASEHRGVMCSRPNAAEIGSGWRLHNNIKTGAAPLRVFRYDANDVALQSSSHNMANGQASSIWASHPSVPAHASLLTLAQWIASTDWEDNSSESNPLLVSSTWGNADLGKLQAGSPARGSGLDFLNLNGAGTSAPCHIGAYSNDSVVIGIRPVS